MPHISIQCYPKNLSEKARSEFCAELTALATRYLHAQDGDVSIDYREILPENWQQVWDKDIAPRMSELLKRPDYQMGKPND